MGGVTAVGVCVMSACDGDVMVMTDALMMPVGDAGDDDLMRSVRSSVRSEMAAMRFLGYRDMHITCAT